MPYIRTFLLTIVILLIVNLSGFCQRITVDTTLMLSHASDKLDSICNSRYMKKKNHWKNKKDSDMDSTELEYFVGFHGLRIKSFRYLNINDTTYGALLLGCIGHGEVILLDSANPKIEILRTEMNLPDMHAGFEKIRDINNDGIPELEIYCSSGSSMMYLCLLSISKDSLSFITDEGGRYQFSASNGNIRTHDDDSDGIYEIICGNKRWPGDPPQDPTIYKWNGSCYYRSDSYYHRKIWTDAEAIRKANFYFGFDEAEGNSILDNAKAELVEMDFGNDSPISRMMNDSKIYRIIFPEVPINLFRKVGDKKTMVDFSVLIDVESGKLLNISSIFKKTSIATNRQDSTSFLWRFCRNINRAYSGLPNEKPYPFLEILRRAPARLSEAIALEAFYILSPSKKGQPDAPRWFLYLDGVPKNVSPPPIFTDSDIIRGRGGIESMEYNIVFDGITGEPRTAGGKSKKE